MNRRKSGSQSGGTFLLVIVTITMIAIFGALSMATSYADLRLTEKLRTTTQNYYKADSEAQKMISYIDSAIIFSQGAQSDSEYLSGVTNSISNIAGASVLQEEGALHIFFEIDISENQTLCAQVYTDFDIKDAQRYIVEEYIIKNTNDQDYGDNPIDVWDGTITQ